MEGNVKYDTTGCNGTEISLCRESCLGCIDCIELGFTQMPCAIPTGYHSL